MRIAVLGVGLIGGSIGRAARERLGAEVVGFDRSPTTLEEALEVGALDRAEPALEAAVAGAEAVFCAAPVFALPELVAAALEASGEGTVVTDAGSTKTGLAAAIAPRAHASRYIGGHPLAGAETAGVRNSRADLFDGARWFLTPTSTSEGLLFDRLHGLVSGLGARPQVIDPDEHDRMMATTSHLPHVLSNVLLARAATSLSTGERVPEVGRSFRDATRVAGANPAIWGDIFAANSDRLADEVEAAAASLGEAAALLRSGDREALRGWQEGVAEKRRVLERDVLEAGELRELRVAVANRPGVVAELALGLSRAGVNIEDMSLSPASDMRTGAVSLWIGGDAEAERAVAVIRELGHAVSEVGEG